MRKKILSLIMIVAMLATIPAYADDIADKKEELEANKNQTEAEKDKLQANKEEQENVEKQIQALDKNIREVEEKIKEIQAELDEQERKVKEAEEALQEAIARKDAQYEATKKRMLMMYKNNKRGYIELIFSSDNFGQLLNRSQYIKTISAYDNQLLEDYKEQERIVENNRQLLAQEQVLIESLFAQQVSVKQQLAAARTEKNKAMGILQSQESEIHANLSKLDDMSKELEEEIKRLTEESKGKYNGGAFAWPVPNYYRISSEYNPREHPISGTWHFHQGIDVPAPYGVPVVAAAGGTVVRAGWWGGFGNAVVVDHGGGLISIYGHNSSVTVSVGDKVQKGQQVAKIGSTGDSTGNHCHFEVRLNGNHTNPWNYLNK